MMKKRIKRVCGILFTLLSALLLSCSEPTLEEDAQEAVELTIQSNQYSKANNYRAAGQAYNEVQEIMTKYKKMDKFDEFYTLYTSLLIDATYNLNDESSENSASFR